MTVLERFDEKWMPEPNSGCWLWLAAAGADGYGKFVMDTSVRPPRPARAHRASWMLRRGAIPDGLTVRHRCDNPSCVNPDHLLLGTQIENIADMVERKRAQRGSGHWTRREPSRVAHGEAKGHLSDLVVEAIRADVARGESQRSVARRYGCSQQHVSKLVRGTRRSR